MNVVYIGIRANLYCIYLNIENLKYLSSLCVSAYDKILESFYFIDMNCKLYYRKLL